MDIISEKTIYQMKISQEELKELWFICNDYLINHPHPEPKDNIYIMAENFHKQFDAIINNRK
jgi:hypothetical protein